MDFLTALAYLVILALITLNAILVANMKIEVRDENKGEPSEWTT